jgi:alanyl-tRNA synthetase
MTLPVRDTEVTYPAGAVAADATVVHVEPLPDGRTAVLLDRTAFHAVDAGWPDQGADRGTLRRSGGEPVEIVDAVVAATDGERLLIGADIPVRTGTEGWVFTVAHLVAAGTPLAEGDPVRVEADATYRQALSIGHTACHLASLALDRALAGAWSKEVPADALGAPAFDALAIESSRILEGGSRDEYRIGKSLRRKGFDPTAFDDPAAVAARANALLAEWVSSDAPVRIEAPEPGLSARRTWVCALPDGEARIPCGGTHVEALGALGAVSVRFDVVDAEGARTVTMHTTATG